MPPARDHQQRAEGGHQVIVKEITKMLERFNSTRESGLSSPEKLQILQDTINEYIMDGKIDPKKGKTAPKEKKIVFFDKNIDAYNEEDAKDNRQRYLGGLASQEEKYPGVCLPGSPICRSI